MESKRFTLNSDAERMAAARYATEEFARQLELDKQDTLRLDLLVEETLGMAKAMLEDFYGQIWFVGEGKTCEIHFEATADMDAAKKHGLIGVSSSGKNAAAKGFMAKIAEVISGVLYGFGQTIDTYGQETMRYGIVHTPGTLAPNVDLMPIWTLEAYRSDVDENREKLADAEEAWDELEKSVVANLADDIVVGVKGDRIDMIIVKKF